MSSGRAYTFAPIFLAHVMAYLALAMLSSLTSDQSILFGWMVSMRSRMALELDMEESWKDLIREDFPDEDSCKGETISHIQFVACFSQIRELLQQSQH